jgi:hypothetical protein
MSPPTTIGQCRACLSRPRVLEQRTGACLECLGRRGRRWVALVIRAREDEAFQMSVRAYLKEPHARKLFDAMFPVVRPVS